MIVGLPKEIKEQEYRVALLPSGPYQLIRHGHQVPKRGQLKKGVS